MNVNAANAQNVKSLSYLLYLYLWPFWVFENASTGSFFERTAAFRRNRSKRGYLPGYIVKWMVIFTVLTSLLTVLEGIGNTWSTWKFSFTLLACGAGILATLAFVVVVMTTATYLLLTHWKY